MHVGQLGLGRVLMTGRAPVDGSAQAMRGEAVGRADGLGDAATLMPGLKQKRRGDCWLERGCAGVPTARLPLADYPENGVLRGYETKTNPVCRVTPKRVMALKEF